MLIMSRLNKLWTIVGAKGTGKTTFLNNTNPSLPPGIIQKWMDARKGRPDERVLIIDTVDHPSYREFQIIEPEHIAHWKKGVKRIIVNQSKFDKLFRVMQTDLINCMVVCEDSTKYIRNNQKINDDLNNFMTDIKQKNIDLLFTYHSIGMANLDIVRMTDILVLFKSPDPPAGAKFGQLATVRSAYQQVMSSENPFEKKIIIIN